MVSPEECKAISTRSGPNHAHRGLKVCLRIVESIIQRILTSLKRTLAPWRRELTSRGPEEAREQLDDARDYHQRLGPRKAPQ